MKTILIILSTFLFSCVTKNYITNNYYPAENKIPLGGVVTPFYGMETSPTFTKTLESLTQTPYTSTLQITLNGTATTLTTGIVSNTVVSTYSASGLNISVNAGDVLKEVFKTATWATNPTSFATSLVLFLVRRS